MSSVLSSIDVLTPRNRLTSLFPFEFMLGQVTWAHLCSLLILYAIQRHYLAQINTSFNQNSNSSSSSSNSNSSSSSNSCFCYCSSIEFIWLCTSIWRFCFQRLMHRQYSSFWCKCWFNSYDLPTWNSKLKSQNLWTWFKLIQNSLTCLGFIHIWNHN